MKPFFNQSNFLGKLSVSAQDEPALNTPAMPIPVSPHARLEAYKAALNLPSALRPIGAPPRVPAVPVRRQLDTAAKQPPKLAQSFEFAQQRWIGHEFIEPSVPAPTSSIDATPVFSQAGARFATLDEQVINPAHRCHTLVTRWSTGPRETPAENLRYGNFMADSVEQAAHDLSSGKFDNLDQLWHHARRARLDSFLVQKQVDTPNQLVGEDATFFKNLGLGRDGSPLTTPMTGRYGYIKDSVESCVREVFRSGTNTVPNQWVCGELTLYHNTFSERWGPETYQLRIAAPGTPPVGKQRPVHWDIDTQGVTGTLSDFDGSFTVCLVNPLVIEALTTVGFGETFSHAQVQTSITQALQATGREDILNHAFKAYWTLVASAPDARGSAAKSHYVLQSILLAKGIDLPPAAAGLAPDLEAMSCTQSAWVARARGVFNL